jgi:hypothetical protein
MNKGRQTLDNYIQKMLFQGIDNPAEDLIEQFKSMECLLAKKTVVKGNFLANDEYSLDTEDILNELSVWSGLVSEKYIAEKEQHDKELFPKDYIAKIITRFVLESIGAVVDMAPDGLKHIPYTVFLALPEMLKIRTRPITGGLLGEILGNMGEKRDTEDFKPYFVGDYGTAVSDVSKQSQMARLQVNEIQNENNALLKDYLANRPEIELERYVEFRKNAAVFLDKLSESAMNSYEDSIVKETCNFIDLLIKVYYNKHPKLFEKDINSMTEILEDGEFSIEKLKDYLDNSPKNFYMESILSGRSPVEKFKNPGLVKRLLRRREPDMSEEEQQYSLEILYSSILREMRRCGQFNDIVFEPLAEMLITHGAHSNLAWNYAMYIRYDKGNPRCLDGMENESTEVRTEFIDTLQMNAKLQIRDIKWYEETLKHSIIYKKTEQEKLELIEQSKAYLQKIDKLNK